MAEVHIVDIDGEQWNIKDQDARNKDIKQDVEIQNLTSGLYKANQNLKRFYYDADTDKDVLQNRINAMIYCLNNSESGIATIRYKEGYYYNVMLPATGLTVDSNFMEIEHTGKINIFKIKSSTDYTLVRSI